MKIKLSKKTKIDILDIKDMFEAIKNKEVTNKPLGSDIEISLEDLDDLQGFLQKEKILIASKQKDMDKELHTVERLDKELTTRINELDEVTKTHDDDPSQIYTKLQDIQEQLKLQKAKLNIEKNKIGLTETKFKNQLKECDKLLDNILQVQQLDIKIKAKARSVDKLDENEDKIRNQVLLRTIRNELAYYLRTYRDLDYSLPDYLQQDPKFEMIKDENTTFEEAYTSKSTKDEATTGIHSYKNYDAYNRINNVYNLKFARNAFKHNMDLDFKSNVVVGGQSQFYRDKYDSVPSISLVPSLINKYNSREISGVKKDPKGKVDML